MAAMYASTCVHGLNDDVLRDAERWREVERASCDVTLRLHNTRSGLRSTVIDAAIDAAKEK